MIIRIYLKNQLTKSNLFAVFFQQALLSTAMDGSLVTSSSSTSAPIERWTYDVFLSFRGEDTRKNFVDHLYAALDQAGIYTFKDDERLQRGKSISPELTRAIQESMIAVVVFSKNYANSSWCLEELAKIIECQDLMGQMVLPVFYDVDPSDVHGQKRSFHVAFEQHEVNLIDNTDKVQSWREALKTAANLSGWDVPKTATGNEAECIKQIVRNILSYTESRPAENLIGMESRVRHVKSLLGKMSGDVRIIGIWGMGGIGKTTIARAVYRQISYEFDGSCFVEDVRENGSDNKGLKSLQEKLLSEILMQEHFKVKDCDDGIYQIRRRLGRKKILIVLDDVDNIKQIEFLAGGCEWFGPGSRILVTTRDEHLLCYAQEKYAPELLKKTEAMKLFSRYAFKANNPPKAYEKLSGLVVSHTGHLPLALKVLGSHFCGRSLEFWQSALNVLAKIPHKEINGILKISFDGLNILEKKIFLYIACFFKGRERFYVTRVLDSFGFEAISGITVLIEKSLLTISKRHLHMHDLIQEMGRCIVGECYPNTLVWVAEEIQEVMTTVTRLEAVEAIVDPENDNDGETSIACCSAEVFKSMKKLKLLQVRGLLTLSEPTYFPEELRWLCWSFYPFESLRITAGMTKLVGLEMRRSQMKQLQIEKTVILTNLKLMDLNRSFSVTSFPDISGVPNLERLYLSYCDSLVEVHQSVLLHERIIHLDLCGCVSLKILPPSIQMKSLQTLLLDDCTSLKKFPEVSKEMEKLLVLRLDGCDKLGALPPSIRLLTGLIVLTMKKKYLEQELEEGLSKRTLPNNLRIQSRTQLSSLRILDLKNNDLVENDFPGDVHNAWSSLEELNLSENNFTRLPVTISHLSHLKYLDLRNCINLEELDELPSRIQVLRADHCMSLEKIRDLSNKYKWLFKISVTGCPRLLMDQESQSQVANLLLKSLVQNCASVNHRLSISVPGSKMPKWFSNRRFGDKITLDLPENQIPKMKGLAICCLFYSPRLKMEAFLKIKFKPSGEEKLIELPASAAENADFVWIGYMSIDLVRNLCYGFDSEDLIISLEPCFSDIVECGVCPVYKDEIQPMTGIGSWIPDYDELGWLDVDSTSREDLQHRRLSLSSFFFGHEKTGDHNTVQVMF